MNPFLSILDFLQSNIALLGSHFEEYLTGEVGDDCKVKMIQQALYYFFYQ